MKLWIAFLLKKVATTISKRDVCTSNWILALHQQTSSHIRRCGKDVQKVSLCVGMGTSLHTKLYVFLFLWVFGLASNTTVLTSSEWMTAAFGRLTHTKKIRDPCIVCGQERSKQSLTAKKCSCRTVKYCSRECQLMHWPIHKKKCTYVTPCTVCGKERSTAAHTRKQCPCRKAKYCSHVCQLMHWSVHKTECTYQINKRSSI